MENKLSHINEKGEANMVDVSSKPDQTREAVASGFISLTAETLEQVKANSRITSYNVCYTKLLRIFNFFFVHFISFLS